MFSEGKLRNIVEEIISSYETRVQNIAEIFTSTHQLLGGFQEHSRNIRREREKINEELRESLAKNESLRRKDFDHMMQGIFSAQDEREIEVREFLNSYILEQKEIAYALRNNLDKVKDALVKGEAERVKEFQEMIKDIFRAQERRREEVSSQLKEFQCEQHQMAKILKNLLAKGRELRIKDFKSMLKEFRAQHQQRLARQEQRKKEVCGMLNGFNKERIEAAKNWRSAQKKMKQRRKECSPEAINIKGKGSLNRENISNGAKK